MSFRTRLTTFFVLIVVVPMTAMGFLVFSLINGSQAGKMSASASGIATSAGNVYEAASVQASLRARGIAEDLAFTPVAQLPVRLAAVAARDGLARVIVTIEGRVVAQTGSPTAVAPGTAVVTATGGRPARTFAVSQLAATQFVRALSGRGVEAVLRAGSGTLASTAPVAVAVALSPGTRTVEIAGHRYGVSLEPLSGFGTTLDLFVLSDTSAAGASVSGDRALAIAFIVGFLVLAFFFTLLSSRALGSQLSRFLEAARRLGGGDFSSPIPTTGKDEFALLGEEFNNMSRQLARRVEELEEERSRVRLAVARIGDAFAAGLDREALLHLALRTAMDATGSERGRVSARRTAEEPLSEVFHEGRLGELGQPIFDAESAALAGDGVAQVTGGDVSVATAAMGPIAPGGPTHGLITVCREQSFSDEDRELLRSLAAQATLAMANVQLHYDIQRQAVTDDLTGLATHGRFQELLTAEMDEVRRYEYPVALIMLDIDDFKAVNDVHGHQQGDLVLRRVGEVLRQLSRDVDVVARYGGEEMAVILAHTTADGAFDTAERLRLAIADLRIPLNGGGTLRITASAGVAATVDGNKDELIAAADGALYVAKRDGKNRTVRAAPRTANVGGGE